MTPERLAEIKAREKAATEGPWKRIEGEDWWDIRASAEPVVSCGSEGEVTVGYEDADFIAHARQDIPDLIAEVERLRYGSIVYDAIINERDAEIARLQEGVKTLRQALNFYELVDE